ncbi:solute carrier family 13 member 5 isoform X1 [Ischnura elegans]|uniref:solute carrier family 13 member 5 isoform X1 n=1 Tax=Ischnura elegans TaxID=197161 RepID=UPI001ED877F9|nr:solute carrier family 13 member 5 isoform X1 [Ischnura elegans]
MAFARIAMVHWKSLVVVLVPLLLLPIPLASYTKAARCGYVVLLMAIYWMTDAVPLPVTSLLPVALFPLLGVLSTEDVCVSYLKETNMMFIGGLAVALAIEHCHLHERIALKVLLLVGTSPRLLMLGFMLTTMFLSMWISNTATTAMMAPIVAAVLKELKMKNHSWSAVKKRSITSIGDKVSSAEEGNANSNMEVEKEPAPRKASVDADEENREGPSQETICYYLGIAYAANIGGTGTVTGTGTNLTFMGIFEGLFPHATGLNFATWMIFNVPGMLINIFIAWVWLQILFMRLFRGGIQAGGPEASKKIKEMIHNKYEQLGPMTFHEGSVLTLFIILVFLWFFRSPQFITGWADVITDIKIKDATPAIFIVFLMYVLPANLDFLPWTSKNGRRPRRACPSLLTWKVLHDRLPWGLILLLGGGFAMAKACNDSGLSKWMGEQLVVLEVLPPWVLVSVICLITTFATEVTSNTAIANIFLPVLGEVSKVIHQHPLYLMMPTTLCCSYAFMLPVATPPNAIVVAVSKMKTVDMMRAGIMMNFLCVFVILILFNTLGRVMFDIDTFPEWAEVANATESTFSTTPTDVPPFLAH